MDDNTIDKFTSQSGYDHDGNEKTPLYAKNDNEKAVLKLIVGLCMAFCIGLLIILLIHINYGSHQLVPHGNVASDDDQCSQYGIDMLKIGGNAVDAAITTALCNSVTLPHLSGLGGNGVMIVYDHRTGKMETIDFRATHSKHVSVGVPGFLAGLFYAHVKYGVLPWKTLVEPSINVANSGIIVTNSLLEAIKQISTPLIDVNLKNWLALVLNTPSGQRVAVPNGLKNTLNTITSGPIEFYKEMSLELKTILKEDEVVGYKPLFLPALKQNFMNYSIITSNNGTGGPILLDILNEMNNTNYKEVWQLNRLKGDWYENSGLQVSTTDVYDLYVTIISGLGSVFGSRSLTHSGFILNNALKLSPKHENINLSKRSSTLHLPFIAIETGKICGRRLVSGSADVRDGAQILLSLLKTDPLNILSVNTIPRFRISKNAIQIENNFPKDIEEVFVKSKYIVSKAYLPYPTCNIIQKVEDKSIAFSDFRGTGRSYTL